MGDIVLSKRQDTSNERMKVLHILDRVGRTSGGALRAVMDTSLQLAKLGHEVSLAATKANEDDLNHLNASEFPGVQTHLFDRTFPTRYANSTGLLKWLRREVQRFDLVEIHAIFSAATICSANICKQRGVPYLVRPHGSLDPFDLQKHRLLKSFVGPVMVRPMLANARGVILTAQREAQRLETYRAAVEKFVVPLPVELATSTGNRKAFRDRWHIAADASVILFLSRIDWKKGLDLLIPAVARLKGEFPGLWLVLAGTGEAAAEAEVNRLIRSSGIESFSSRIGFVAGQEKADSFAGCDIFALPSRNENFGIVNIEAMHAGVPLMISDEVYIGREIEEANAGVICKPTMESVAEKLRCMLNGSIDLKAMGQRGRELVARSYQPHVTTQSLIRLYEGVLAEHHSKRHSGNERH